MLGQFQITPDIMIDGPFLLGQESLLSLDELLKNIHNKLEASRIDNKNNKTEIPARLGIAYTVDIDNIPISTKITIFSKDRTTKYTAYPDIKSILKDHQTKDFSVHELKVLIGSGIPQNQFELTIVCGRDGDIECKLRCYDHSVLHEMYYEINEWIKKHKPNTVVRAWSNISILVAIFGGLFVIIGFFLAFSSEDYETVVNRQAIHLLDSGINQSNLPHAVDILLKLQTKYIPKNYIGVYEFDPDYFRTVLLWFIIYLIIIISPSTVIEIGKGAWKVNFYKQWIKWNVYTIPGLIIVPKIVEKVNLMFFH